jgi:probable selenium-dependent hydroxylase accessory protein YqeC
MSRTTAIIGGGGKTTLMFRLAAELSRARRTIITSTTTRILRPHRMLSPFVALQTDGFSIAQLVKLLSEYRHISVAGYEKEGKLFPPDSEFLRECGRVADHLIIEADGARELPIKAPAEWEPVIPPYTSLVIAVAGLDALGKPLDERTVFRPELFAAISGIKVGEILNWEAIETALRSCPGLLKGTPSSSEAVFYLNKADIVPDSTFPADMVERLRKSPPPLLRALAWGSLRDPVRIDTAELRE